MTPQQIIVRPVVTEKSTDLQGRKIFKVFNQEFIVDERYTVTKELGQGAYGIVWYARRRAPPAMMPGRNRSIPTRRCACWRRHSTTPSASSPTRLVCPRRR